MSVALYAELQVTTHYSFLRGASSPEELFATAALLGLPALGVTDRNSLAGIVRAHEAAKVTGVRLVVGCRIDLEDGPSLLAYPTDRASYSRLCRLLTLGKSRVEKGKCLLTFDDLVAWSEGLVVVLLTHAPDEQLKTDLRRLRGEFGDHAYCALNRRFGPNDHVRLAGIADLAQRERVPILVTGDVLYHEPERRILQDVVTCIRLGATIDSAGFRKERHAGRSLKPPQEVARLFECYPDAVARSLEIVERCRFSLDELTYTYPTEDGENGVPAQERLEALVWEGAKNRYPDGVLEQVAAQIRHELSLIADSDEVGRAFRRDVGHAFRSMSATCSD